MVTNVLRALLNIQKYSTSDLNKIFVISSSGKPRVNSEGDKLEAFVKDSLCNSFNITDPLKKKESYLKELSHLGSQNNPPDIIIRGGDAIEVKKVQGFGTSAIALNSSFPKQKLFVEDPMITQDCRECEVWKEKDFVYCVGNLQGTHLAVLSFIYGDCYAANEEYYVQIKKSLIEGIKKLKGEFSNTKELARLNKIDPLKITDLRVRGMWQIRPPLSIFSEFIKYNSKQKLSVYAIMTEKKYNSFPLEDRKKIEKGMNIKRIKINDPVNSSQKIASRLISFVI